jgi:hypothetical protein
MSHPHLVESLQGVVDRTALQRVLVETFGECRGQVRRFEHKRLPVSCPDANDALQRIAGGNRQPFGEFATGRDGHPFENEGPLVAATRLNLPGECVEAGQAAFEDALGAIWLGDEGAASAAALASDEALGGQHAERMPNRMAAYTEVCGEIVFAWQPGASLDLTIANELAKSRFELTVQGSLVCASQGSGQEAWVDVSDLHYLVEGTYIYTSIAPLRSRFGMRLRNEFRQGGRVTSSRSAELDPPAPDSAAAVLAQDVRRHFTRGFSAESSAAFFRARDAQLPWETISRAVADGVFDRFGYPPGLVAVTASSPRLGSVVLTALAAYVVLRPMLGLGHELSVGAVAALLHAVVGTGVWQPMIGWLGLDPIYAGAAIRAAGGVQVDGLAVAGPLGGWLHALLPRLILSPDAVAAEAGISMVAAPGAPALGRGLAGFGADVLWLVVGLRLAWNWPRKRPTLGVLGLLIQAQIVINHLLDAQLNIPDLEASGLPLALAIASPNGTPWFSRDLLQLPDFVRALVVGGGLVLLGYVCAGAALMIIARPWWLARQWRRAQHSGRRAGHGRLVLVGAAVAVATAISPVGALAVGVSNWTGLPSTLHRSSHRFVPGALGRLNGLLNSPGAAGPTRVQVEQRADGTWRYLVRGQPQVMRGVGYNPQYAALDPGERARLYQRDFGAMRQLGINTIEGWFEPQFDQLTLDYAARNGVGVLMPFELNQDWPYEDPNVRQSVLDHLSAYVERYKNHPAVRMWAPGNENLHRILYPHWTNQRNDPAVRARAAAFAAFLPVLVDRINALDPDHPVLYRDAEDVYLPTLAAAFRADGVERPWLVYGANVYSSARLQQIVAAWPSQWLGGPLVISEFAPGGVSPAERAVGFEQDWAIIRSRPDVVLGGIAYTWATNGPEQLDRVFGLVDAQAIPTDGALAALSATYLADLDQSASAVPRD